MASVTPRAIAGSFSQRGPELALSKMESSCLNFFPEGTSGGEDCVAQPILAVLLREVGREPNSLQVRKIGGTVWVPVREVSMVVGHVVAGVQTRRNL